MIFIKMSQKNHLYLQGDGTQEKFIVKAGVHRARGLIGLLASDADNVYIVLTARTLNPYIFIIARNTDEIFERRLKQAGADKVICPYQMGAIRMV